MNWSYIAGFFDGEGSISPNNGGFRVSIPQTSEQVFSEIRDFTKMGFILSLKKRRDHWSDSWIYYLASKQDVCIFLENMLPHLVVKKELAQNAIRILRQQLIGMEKKKRTHDTRKEKAKKLKSMGWNYRKIGKELKIDWGYARRLILDLA